jgi:glycine amidinotransferase
MTEVLSYTEWDPLEEVIVGTACGAVRSAFEPSFAPFASSDDPERSFAGGRYTQQEIDEAQAQLDHFASLLEGQGITVRRPEPLDHDVPVRTPDFTCELGHAQTCPRDVLLVIGDQIIEAPMTNRCRFFEYRAYRMLLKEYFRHGAHWVAAPKTTMSDDLYVCDYDPAEGPFDFASRSNLTEFELCFDAACFARMGRDIFWQPDIVSNQFGADWLERHLGPSFRLHRVEFEDSHPHHIDATMVPLRPGLLLVNPDRPAKKGCLRVFEENDWEIIEAAHSVRAKKASTAWEVSNWISMNILSLDEQTIVADARETLLIEQLTELGFTVLTCPFDAVFRFGGSFHCCSLDIRRRGALQSYFPSLDEEATTAPVLAVHT